MRPDELSRRRLPWSIDEIQILRECWQALTAIELAEKLPGRNWTSIVKKSRSMKLPSGIPRGYESVRDASRRTNYDNKALMKLIRRHRVKIHTLYAKDGTGRSRYTYVEPGLVDAAIVADLDLESIDLASRRLGIHRDTLSALVRMHGHHETKPRLRPSIYDAIAESWRHRGDTDRVELRDVTEAQALAWIKTRRKCAPSTRTDLGALLRAIHEDPRLDAALASLLSLVANTGALPSAPPSKDTAP